MRIVAGTARGRRIQAPRGMDVRPTTDRVREALFSSLTGRLTGARVLDLFAGTGALGLEALSRGAASAVFVEQNRHTAQTLAKNIQLCEMTDLSSIISRDALAALKGLAKRGAVFDIIFLDPPYQGPMLEKVLSVLPKAAVLARDALIIAEHPRDLPPRLPEQLKIVTMKHYGKTVLSFIEELNEEEVSVTHSPRSP